MRGIVRFHRLWIATAVSVILASIPLPAASDSAASGQGLEVEVVKKGLGKEVSMRQGEKEWFMLVEVTPENTVVIRQEKDHDQYLVDESETHDRSWTPGEVDAAIDAFITSVTHQTKRK